MGVKGQKSHQKIIQNDKKTLSVTLHISQEPYIIWLSFLVYTRKMVISSGAFFNFWKLQFSGSSVWWKDKKWFKMTKNFVCRTLKLCWSCFGQTAYNSLALLTSITPQYDQSILLQILHFHFLNLTASLISDFVAYV